jgi:hypothetical protein
MLPITRVPETIAQGMAKFRSVFCREEGFEHVSRYVTGLVMSPNKTLQGMYDLQVWDRQAPSRRAMHAGVFEAGWDDAGLRLVHGIMHRLRDGVEQSLLGIRGKIHHDTGLRSYRRGHLDIQHDFTIGAV